MDNAIRRSALELQIIDESVKPNFRLPFTSCKQIWESIDLEQAFLQFENDTRFIASLATTMGRNLYDTSLFLNLLGDYINLEHFSVIHNANSETYSIRCITNSILIYELFFTGTYDCYDPSYAKLMKSEDFYRMIYEPEVQEKMRNLALTSIQFGDKRYTFQTNINLIKHKHRLFDTINNVLSVHLMQPRFSIEQKWNKFDFGEAMIEIERRLR